MENYQYPSYPDSGDSSPRSREIDFENPPPWDDQQTQNYKAKFMCSYGGKIQPRTHDNQLSYVGGDTKILAVDRAIKFPAFLSKLSSLCGATPQDLTFKYQLPGEDLDALISVTNDDDLEHMMHEYDRLYRPNAKPVRMRLFLFTLSSNPNSSFSSDRDRFVDALNSAPIPPQPDPIKNPTVTPSNVDYLFGLDKAVAPPTLPPSFAAVKFHDPAPEPVAPQPEYQVRGGISVSDRVVGSEQSANSIEIQRQLQQEMQRLQVAENEYRRRSEDGFAGGYAAAGGDYYMQKMPEKAPPVNAPHPAGYWPEKQFSGEGFQTTVTTAPGGADQQVYVIPAPGTFYHAPVVRPPAAQGYYAVQRMGSDGFREQAVYGGVSQQKTAFSSAGPAQPVKPSGYAEGYGVVRPGGVPDNAAYTQLAYDSASGRQVYYTAQGGVVGVPPQYQGVQPVVGSDVRPVGVSVGQDVKVVNKVNQGSV
uniref:Octicosapeptide/Phox/Bem1p domain-containing protein n=1 Tax=Phaseolus vulgaris TaxID=3885 RepID=T2DP86_PHAVU|nr:octicosapeptide/Phox/Bem1p domain-containing protein [Phaseolus vulgaris]